MILTHAPRLVERRTLVRGLLLAALAVASLLSATGREATSEFSDLMAVSPN